jgi:hypothetical protein
MKTSVSMCALFAGATLLAGCASMQSRSPVRVDMAETGPPHCQSFAWNPTSQQPASFTEQRMQREIMARLKEKGYSEASDKAKADCRVTYVLDVHEAARGKPSVGVGAGGGSGGIGGGIGVSLPIGKRNQQSGTFAIDVIDAKKNAQVWSGSIDGSFSKAELNEDDAREVVAKVLERFPDHK